MPFTIDKDRVKMFQEEPLEAETEKKSEVDLVNLLDLTDLVMTLRHLPGKHNPDNDDKDSL